MLYEKTKAVAKEKGISIAELEKKCKLSQGSICKWNEVKPAFDKVVLVADCLGVKVEAFAAVCREELKKKAAGTSE